MLDARQLNYLYFWIDKQKAAKKSNRVQYDFNDADGDGRTFSYKDYIKDGKAISDRSSFFESEIVNIYPDTLVWLADFTYSFNEQMHDNYFWHPAYDNYPCGRRELEASDGLLQLAHALPQRVLEGQQRLPGE